LGLAPERPLPIPEEVKYNMFEWFWLLPFLQQFLIISLILAVVNFLICMFLEFGPLASASPLSGGLGFIAVFIIDLILAVLGAIFDAVHDPLKWMMAPLLGYVWMVVVIVVCAVLYQGFLRAMARGIGLKD
jgi:uncharacterized membrane protein